MVPNDKNPAFRYVRIDQVADSTKANAIAALRKISYGIADSDWTEFPWWEITTAEQVEGLMVYLRDYGDLAGRTATDHFRKLVGMLQRSWQMGYISDGEWMRIQSLKMKVAKQPLDKARITTPDEWLRIAGALDLTQPHGFMRLATLACLYPLGMRPSDACSIKRKDFEPHNQLVNVWRPKNAKQGAVLLDDLPNVQRALELWWDLIPDQEYAWFHLTTTRGVRWDKPMVNPSKDGSASLARFLMRNMAAELGIEDFRPRCGRVALKTHATNAGVAEWQIAAQGGWEAGDSASWDYYAGRLEERRGAFANVPEFQKFDRGLGGMLERITGLPAIVDDLPEPRFCAECAELLEEDVRGDAKFCSKKCRMRAYRKRRDG